MYTKILRLVCAQYTNSSCLASHSSLFLYSVFKVQVGFATVVGSNGLEPSTSRLSGVRSNHLSYEPMSVAVPVTICGQPVGGDEQNRTVDPLLARQVLSQLSYTPVFDRFASTVF